MKTFIPKIQSKSERKWYVVDADGKVAGRLAAEIANILRGKNKASFTPHMDMGDYVVVINAEKIRLTGNKEEQKEYITHSGYFGNLRRRSFKAVQQRQPSRILKEAVSGMLPKNRLRRHFMDKLHIYAGMEHPHAGQNPIAINL